jgi:hypothetical protein
MNPRALRGRLPLVVLILLALLCFALLGFACACLSDQPLQVLAQTLAAISLAPALVELWPVLALAVLGAAAFLATRTLAPSARSPAALQRFLL